MSLDRKISPLADPQNIFAAFPPAPPIIQPKTPWISVAVTGFLTFVNALHFSMFFAPVWPYMQIMDSSATETFYGVVVASYSMGQLCSAPIMGWWSHRRKSIYLPTFCCVLACLCGNILYVCAGLLPSNRKYAVLAARFMAGMGETSMSLMRTYISMASLPKDRSRALATMSFGLGMGTTLGPIIQLFLIPIGYPGIQFTKLFGINMYTAPAYFCMVGNLLSILSWLCIFKEKYENMSHHGPANNPTHSLPPADKKALSLCYLTRFTQFFVLTNLETIGATYVMVMFALNKQDTVQYMSTAHIGMGIMALLMYTVFISGRHDSKVDFRIVAVVAIVVMLSFHLITFSWPFLGTQLKTYSENDYLSYLAGNRSSEPLGCNTDHFTWCYSISPTNIWLYFISFGVMIGYAFSTINISVSTLMSNIIGPRNQAREQSVFQMMQSIARLLGPIAISSLYTSFGPMLAWLLEIVVLGLTLLAWALFYKRMVPLKIVQTIPQKPSFVFTMDDYSDDSFTFEKEKEPGSVYRL
ncbi:unnamed protein product [Bursaphelenchus xylophilus]|uniref:(pine wood nematode) hypothetical protein n=1 Tax=Bursaphelenchus xylophilus TaxID=6326 RepID=A0A1I7SLB5_BURXY|nr:unnamed protein product [Bursaphelenchus xylophilus]CAG9129466.1 unnamed protein product [Bursaphelenchus xylophilus]